MKKSTQLLLAVIIFFCGLLLGQFLPPAFQVENAQAYQGPKIESLACNLSVSASCNKVDGTKYAYLTITGTPEVNRAWGASFSNNIYGSPTLTVRLK